ncbi:MAG: hypothetical protein U1F20_00745 [Lysobacterales bacterium]
MTEASLLLATDRKAEAAKVAMETARQSPQALDRDTPADKPDELGVALSSALVALRANAGGNSAKEVLNAVDVRPHFRALPYIAEMQAVVCAWQAIDRRDPTGCNRHTQALRGCVIAIPDTQGVAAGIPPCRRPRSSNGTSQVATATTRIGPISSWAAVNAGRLNVGHRQ